MANNYAQFSIALPLRNKQEIEWAEARVGRSEELEEFLAELQAKIDSGAAKPEDIDPIHLSQGGCVVEHYEHPHYLGNGVAQLRVEEGVEAAELWFCAEENGDIDPVAEMLQQYFITWMPEGHTVITAAYTCSRMYVGEFSGDQIYVDAEEIIYANTTLHAHITDLRGKEWLSAGRI